MPVSELFVARDGTEIPLVPTPFCGYCAKPLRDDYGRWGFCYRCRNRFRELELENPGRTAFSPYAFSRAVAAGLYITDEPEKGSAGRLITGLKASGAHAQSLAEAIAYVLRTRSPGLFWDVIVPVPQSPGKPFYPVVLLADSLRLQTGTDSAAVLGLDASYACGQSLPEMEKFNNMRGKVGVVRPDSIVGKRVLLVDDIMTTAGVAHWCADALMRCGASAVNVAVAGRSVDMRHLGHIEYSGPY